MWKWLNVCPDVPAGQEGQAHGDDEDHVASHGEYERAPGFFVLVAGGWGFALSPVLSQLMAELVSGEAVSLPIEAFGLTECLNRA